MNYTSNSKFRRMIFLIFALYLFVIYFIYYDNKTNEIENERIKIEDLLIQIKAIRKYISNDQKEQIYKLQDKGVLSHDYFSSPLLSSTYSANKINDYYNDIKKGKNLITTDIRFAATNARNPKNKATFEEEQILNDFVNNKSERYEKILKTKDGDVLYIALPTRKLEAKCMRCHTTPEAAPKDLVLKYGDKLGFGEEIGNVKAILSVKKPLKEAYARASSQTIKSSIYILIAIIIFIFFYYRFNKQLYAKNRELNLLNQHLDDKIKDKTKDLNKTKKQLLNVINGSELGFWEYNVKDNHLFVDERWLSMLNFLPYSSITARDWLRRIFIKDRRHLISKLKESFKNGKSFSCEYQIRDNTNSYIWIEVVGGIVQRDEDGRPIQIAGIHRNINAKKLNENKIKEQKRLIDNQMKISAVGEMLKNISHQWKQPLSVITTVASTIKLNYELNRQMSEEQLVNFTDEILNNGNYLARIINDFSSYFDDDIHVKRDISIYNTIKKVEHLVKNVQESHDIVFVYNIKEDFTIKANENIFTQALLNIVNNSAEAFVAKGISEQYIFISIKKNESNIIINICDNALGIDEKLLNKLFEPYFTTEHKSLGKGIGLYMTNQVISKHLDGTIDVKNNAFLYNNSLHKGICFEIKIPISKE